MKTVFEKAAMFWVGIVVTSLMLACMKPAEATQFHVTKDGEVGAYFAGQSADYDNLAGIIFDDRVVSPLPTNDPVFINNHVSSIGDYTSFGTGVKGESVLFYDFILNTLDTWYSSTTMNSDGQNHLFYSPFNLPDGTSALLIGFEDLKGGGDLDFNDTMMIFTNVSPVPEPSTYLMMAIGLIVLRFATF